MIFGRFIFLAFLTTSLSACAMGMGPSEYSCNGLPEGIQCRSTLEVHEMTNYSSDLNAQPNKKGEKSQKVDDTASTHKPEVKLTATDYAVRNLQGEAPIPIRTPAGVMRLSVGPWEDKTGQLHTGERIYVEVEERRWAIGEETDTRSATLHPLDVRVRNKPQVRGNDRMDLSTMQPVLPTPPPNK